jgi:ABC-type transport system involved in multi-copper enzyme maturation permease subunit
VTALAVRRRTADTGFARVLHAEWTKFRTVRGWVLGLIIAALAMAALGLAPGQGSCNVAACTPPVGPGGELVSDSYYFVHQPLSGNGSITVRVTALTGQLPSAAPGPGMRPGLMPWAKAGVMITASTRQGSAYAAMMVTGHHGVRMQWDYTQDTAGLPGAVSAAAPRWLRLTRSGDTLTGYDSADGTRWDRVGSIRLAGLPGRVQAGLFATSPQYEASQLLSVSGGPSQATGTFDHLRLADSGQPAGWAGSSIGAPGGGAPGPSTGYHQAGDQFTVTGTGDIAPAVPGAAGLGTTVAQPLTGTFAALIGMVVVAVMLGSAEYRRGLISTTLAASPRRGQVLAAKAVVIAAVTFAAGLAAAAVVVTLGVRMLRDSGVYVWPVPTLTGLRVVAGTAALLAVAAVLGLAIGTMLRRSAAAVAAAIVVIVLPYLFSVAIPVLPAGAAEWLLRLSPAAAFAVQQTVPQYAQVDNAYTPVFGYYPLPSWAGLAVLCGWAAIALAAAAVLLNRRDA